MGGEPRLVRGSQLGLPVEAVWLVYAHLEDVATADVALLAAHPQERASHWLCCLEYVEMIRF